MSPGREGIEVREEGEDEGGRGHEVHRRVATDMRWDAMVHRVSFPVGLFISCSWSNQAATKYRNRRLTLRSTTITLGGTALRGTNGRHSSGAQALPLWCLARWRHQSASSLDSKVSQSTVIG